MKQFKDLVKGDRVKVTLGHIIEGEFDGYETIAGGNFPIIIVDGGGPAETGQFVSGRKRIITQSNVVRIEDADS